MVQEAAHGLVVIHEHAIKLEDRGGAATMTEAGMGQFFSYILLRLQIRISSSWIALFLGLYHTRGGNHGEAFKPQ